MELLLVVKSMATRELIAAGFVSQKECKGTRQGATRKSTTFQRCATLQRENVRAILALYL